MEINKPRRPVLLSVSVVSEPATAPVANGLLSTNDRFVKEVCRYIICSLRHIHTCTYTTVICGCVYGNYHSFGRYLSHRIHNNNIAESLYNVCLYDVCMNVILYVYPLSIFRCSMYKCMGALHVRHLCSHLPSPSPRCHYFHWLFVLVWVCRYQQTMLFICYCFDFVVNY